MTAPTSKQLGLVDGRRFEDFPSWDGQGVPTFANCDRTNPRQAFLPMFTALPGMRGAPLMMPVEYWELVSWRQWILGARPAEEPQLKWLPPLNMVSNPWNATGSWVNLDAPEPEQTTLAEAMRALPQHDRAEIRAEVLNQFGLGEEVPEVPLGQYRVADLAVRLDQPVEAVVEVLGNFGMKVAPDALVGRDVADRIAVHLGLD